MDNVGYIALSRAAMIERSTNMVANNIANATTDGYRAKQAQFAELVADSRTDDQMREMSYALDKGGYLDLREGDLAPTGNSLDVAIQGDGWFGFLRDDGQTALGRTGRFALDANGQLVTPAGHAVLDDGGAPIIIPPETGDIHIAADGSISGADGEIIAMLGVFEAPGIERWRSLDGMMHVPQEGPAPLNPAVDARLVQGFAEGSNVNPVLEMTRMITLQRSFEQTMNLADTANTLRRQTIERLGRA